MLRNYLKIAARHLWTHRSYTALNVLGLAVSMATCLLIGLYVQDELSYDSFHSQEDQIVWLTLENDFFEGRRRITPYPLGEAVARDVPGIKHVTRTKGNPDDERVRRGDSPQEATRTLEVLRTDSSFFRVFDGFHMRRGNASAVLTAPGQAVITDSTARALFGEVNPIGRTLTIQRDSLEKYTVAGVVQIPANSSIQFDVAIPLAPTPTSQQRWGTYMFHTYARLEPGVQPDSLGATIESAIPDDAAKYVSAVEGRPLSELYLSDLRDAPGFRGEAKYIYIFLTVALLILLIAAINYVNLVTAQADERMREVGVRKTVGASRAQLARQFLGETVLVCSIALVLAVALTAAALPAFNVLFGKNLTLWSPRHLWALGNAIAVVLGVALLAGAYPAFVLSGFTPTRILRGASGTVTSGGGWLRKGLVVTQFAASAALILGTVIIYHQLDYLQEKDLGFDGEQVVTVDLRGVSESRQETIRQEVLKHAGVVEAAVGDAVPGGFGVTFSGEPTDFSSAAATDRERIEIRPAKVDSAYVETLGLEVLAGHSFLTRARSDQTQGYLLNKSAATAFGWTAEEAVGKPFIFGQAKDDPVGEVIGVIADFHIESLRSQISPVVLTLEAERFASSAGVLATRLAPTKIRSGMDHVRQVMRSIAPSVEFEYTFLDDKFDAMYRSEQRLAGIFAGFALIAIIVSCMGLFALAAFAAQRRTREIGIRKALGASAASIVGLLSKEYALLLSVAFLIGMPASYVGMQRWLQEFAYRADVGAGAFLLTAAVALLVAGLSVSVHAIRAARTDPARVLRTE